MSIRITLDGNLGKNPELTYNGQGQARLNISIGATPRRKNQQTGQWEDDGLTQWYSLTLWGDQAETYASTLTKGARVHVEGNLIHTPTQNQDGTQSIFYNIKGATITLYPTQPSQTHKNQFSGTNSPQPHTGTTAPTYAPQNGAQQTYGNPPF